MYVCVHVYIYMCVYQNTEHWHTAVSVSRSPSVRKILALLIEICSIVLCSHDRSIGTLRLTKTTPVTPEITPAAIAALTAAVRSSLVIPRWYKLAQTLYPLASSDVWPNPHSAVWPQTVYRKQSGRFESYVNELLSPLSTAIFVLTLDAISRCFSV